MKPSPLESLTKASHSLNFAVSDLREGHSACGPVASAAVLPLLERCARLANEVAMVTAAFVAEQEEAAAAASTPVPT